jgi:ubiquinone/menaquinone biosynthesis C-methylase UbiE
MLTIASNKLQWQGTESTDVAAERSHSRMSTPDNRRQENPNTYFVYDRSNEEEYTRLNIQDQLITASMGGVLPEQPDPASFKRVLDVGCGTGGWLIEAAKNYPTMSMLVGADVNKQLLGYAQAQAEVQQVSDRVHFQAMDALLTLEFPQGYFDLVNMRFGWSFLRTWNWPKLLDEFQRITRPGGVIRITESDMIVPHGSPALQRLLDLFFAGMWSAGHFFIEQGNGVTSELPRLLPQQGLQQVQTLIHRLIYRAGTEEGRLFYEDMKHVFRVVVPFLRKWASLPDDYEAIYQQALIEMQQPGFEASWDLLTAWGNPSRRRRTVE